MKFHSLQVDEVNIAFMSVFFSEEETLHHRSAVVFSWLNVEQQDCIVCWLYQMLGRRYIAAALTS